MFLGKSRKIHLKKMKEMEIEAEKKENQLEDYKKLCVKYLISPHPLFNEQITKNQITFYLENYSLKDTIIISQILSKYFYFKHIKISDKDTNKKRYCKINYYEIEKEKKDKEEERRANIARKNCK